VPAFLFFETSCKLSNERKREIFDPIGSRRRRRRRRRRREAERFLVVLQGFFSFFPLSSVES
jgi:hypothetical protein